MRPILFIGAVAWGAAMQMGYMRLLDDPTLSDRTIGMVTIIFYAVVLLSLVACFLGGEASFIGYIISMLFVGAYRQRRRRSRR